MSAKHVTILGAFFADLACRTPRMPDWGETLHGNSFAIGPGGKGSNQAVAAVRQGASASLISRVGRDMFGEMARRLYREEGIDARHVSEDPDTPSGTATILLDDARGENSIVIVPGACGQMSEADVDAAQDVMEASAIFVSQLELPVELCLHAMARAHRLGVPVLLNPAPVVDLPREAFARIDYLTPNQSEAGRLVGQRIETMPDVAAAAATLRDWGVRHVLVTLGDQGVYVHSDDFEGTIPAIQAGPVIDTTGAGDAFNGGFAAALAEGRSLQDAAHFGCVVAGLSVTRPGAAASMPSRSEVENVLERA